MRSLLFSLGMLTTACAPSPTSIGDRGPDTQGDGTTSGGSTGLVPTGTATDTSTSGGSGTGGGGGTTGIGTGIGTGITTGTAGVDGTTSGSGSTGLGTGTTLGTIGTTGEPPPTIVGFRLADADADMLLGPVVDGDIVDPADYGGAALSLAAEANPETIGSVVFIVDNEAGLTENFVPYTVGGNLEEDIRPWPLTPGVHTIWALPYTEANGNGEAGVAGVVTFELL